jgi:ankyrin repeat protein
MVNMRLQKQQQQPQEHQQVPSSPRKKKFWRRQAPDQPAFVQQDKDGRTVLHAALTHSSTPTDVLLLLIKVDPKAAAIPNAKGRLPLHTAVWYGHDVEVIAELVEAYPAAIGHADGRGQTPLAYAMANAIAQTHLETAPCLYWMPVVPHVDDEEDDGEESSQYAMREQKLWQEEAVERWSIVHWLLLSSATHPQTSLTVGGQKPMLVEALVFAAPPAVVLLLIGASVALLSYEKRASAFAGTTLYTCIARQYPASILMALALQCPADVRTVSDETGMGLVAAQFVVGCFQRRNDMMEEWSQNDEIWMSIQETLQEGALPDETIDPAFVDWWIKIEFLLAFCGTTPQHARSMSASSQSEYRQYLLHQACLNPDVPPTILRLLLALYPKSVSLPAVSEQFGTKRAGALPLTLIAQTPDYIPRNYELPVLMTEHALDIVCQARPQSAWETHGGRLPLHWAIAAGKSYQTIQNLVNIDPDRMLRTLDGQTRLYPFLLAAYIYGVNGLGKMPKNPKVRISNDDTSVSSADDYDAPDQLYMRWTRIARNQYTHHVWKGLSERQKAAAVYRVIQGRSLAGLSTIWQLLMYTPDLVPVSPFKRVPTNSARDDRGVGTVATHFLSWAYHSASFIRTNTTGDPDGVNEEHWGVLQDAINTADSGGWARLPSSFLMWFNKLRFWIRYCCPANPAVRRGNNKSLRVDPRWNIPGNDDDYVLHMALMNPDTPPIVVALLLAAKPFSVEATIPGTGFLPLHIACRTPIYIPRFFEKPCDTSIHILTRLFPEATDKADDDGKLPLHRAIESRKPWSDIEILVRNNPHSLLVRTPDTRLFPFQQMALPRPRTRIQRLNTMYKARNSFETEVWESYAPRGKVKAARDVLKAETLDVLTSIFELFRRNVSMIEPSTETNYVEYVMEDQKLACVMDSSSSSDSTLEVPGMSVTNHADCEMESESMTENDTIYSAMAEESQHNATSTFVHGRVGNSPRKSGPKEDSDADSDSENSEDLESYLPNRRHSSGLMTYLSNQEKPTEPIEGPSEERSVFDCDTSVLSNVDVLSTLSSTLHSTLHSTFHRSPTGTSRRLSDVNRKEARVSEHAEESTKHRSQSSSESESSSDSGSEFAGDSSAYLSFAISGNSGHLSMDDDDMGDGVSYTVQSDAVSFASSAVQSVSENSNSESSSSSLVHFQLRRKQRVEYWEDRETLDPVRVTKQNLQIRTDDISSVYSGVPPSEKQGSDSQSMTSANQGSSSFSSAHQSFLNQASDSMDSAHQSFANSFTNNETGNESFDQESSSEAKETESPMSKSVSLRSVKSTGVDSFVSLKSTDLMQNSTTDMVWMPEELIRGNKLLEGQNSSREFDDSALVGLSSPHSTKEPLKYFMGSAIERSSGSEVSDGATEDQATFHESDHHSAEDFFEVRNLIRVQDGDSESSSEDVEDILAKSTGQKNEAGSPKLQDPGYENEPDRNDSVSTTNSPSVAKKSTEKLRDLLSSSHHAKRDILGNSAHSESSIEMDDVFTSNVNIVDSIANVRGRSDRGVVTEVKKIESVDEGNATATGSVQSDIASIPVSESEENGSTQSDLPMTKNTETCEVVYFDRSEMRWKKKKVEKPKEASLSLSSLHFSPQNSDEKASQVAAKKKEMYFDRKSMRWKVREATGENSARNLETNLSSIDENRAASASLLAQRQELRSGNASNQANVSLNKAKSTKSPKHMSVKKRLDRMVAKRSSNASSLLSSKNMTCLMCSKNPREVLLKPCQHLAICRVCSSEYTEIVMCPLCEEAVNDRMLVI